MKMLYPLKLVAIILVLQLLQACSGNNFHLRKSVELPATHKNIQLGKVSNSLRQALILAIEDVGGHVVSSSKTKITFNNFRERKQPVAYTSTRKARIYLLSLKFEYEIQTSSKRLKKQRINLDRSFVYDANFALGKAEEEKRIRADLYTEAARLILLKLQSTK